MKVNIFKRPSVLGSHILNWIRWGRLYDLCSLCVGKSAGWFETSLTSSFSLLVQSFGWEMNPLGSWMLWISCCRLASRWCCFSSISHPCSQPHPLRLCLHYWLIFFSLLLLCAQFQCNPNKACSECIRFCYISYISSRRLTTTEYITLYYITSCNTHQPAPEPSWWTALLGLSLWSSWNPHCTRWGLEAGMCRWASQEGTARWYTHWPPAAAPGRR